MKLILSLVIFSLSWNAFSAQGSVTEDVLEISPRQKVYYRYTPAQKGQPTFVALNGLIYPIKYWDSFLEEMQEKGFGLLQIAYSTQPESLSELTQRPRFFFENIETKDLSDEVMAVVDQVGLKKFELLTLSYGSIVGADLADRYADRLNSVTMMSPAVRPSNRYHLYGESRHQYYEWLSQVSTEADRYYDAELFVSMLPIVKSQEASFELMGVDFDTFFKGVYQMARSAKWFDLKERVSNKRWPKTNFVFASEEEVGLSQDQEASWEILKSTSPHSIKITVNGAPHAIPGVHPKTAVRVLEGLMENQYQPGEHEVELSLGQEKPDSGSGSSESSATDSIKTDSIKETSLLSSDRSSSCSQLLGSKKD
ncbi:MAG: hypothetical protein GW917_01215 [Bdellovibrionales bacterium]|nr:hypothetical protein [Bdellovibrionales bacterium]